MVLLSRFQSDGPFQTDVLICRPGHVGTLSKAVTVLFYLDGKRVQLLDIYYSGVGILHELTPEEMEEAFQQHLTERNKEKTA